LLLGLGSSTLILLLTLLASLFTGLVLSGPSSTLLGFLAVLILSLFLLIS